MGRGMRWNCLDLVIKISLKCIGMKKGEILEGAELHVNDVAIFLLHPLIKPDDIPLHFSRGK